MAYYQDKGLGIDELTIGMSSSGVEEYKSKLKADLLTTVSEKINDVEAIEKAFNKGWQGKSRDAFDKQFAQQRANIIKDLEEEYRNIENRINDLEANYLNQDKNMILD